MTHAAARVMTFRPQNWEGRIDVSDSLRGPGPVFGPPQEHVVSIATEVLSASIERFYFEGDTAGYQDYVDLGQGACVVISNLDRIPAMEYEQSSRDDILMVQFRTDGMMSVHTGGAWHVADRRTCLVSYAAPGHLRAVRLEAGPFRSVAFICHRDALNRWGLHEELLPLLGERIDRHEPAFLWAPVPMLATEAIRSLFTCTYTGELRRAFAEAKCIEAICSVLDAWEHNDAGAAQSLSASEVRRVKAAHEILEAEFDQPLTLFGIARRVGLNRSKLAAAFKALFDVTVHDRLRELRMAEARRLLNEGAPVYDVAFAVGYENSGSFARAFKDRFGIVPSLARNPGLVLHLKRPTQN
jgi:AraC-like DNA-binding protein